MSQTKVNQDLYKNLKNISLFSVLSYLVDINVDTYVAIEDGVVGIAPSNASLKSFQKTAVPDVPLSIFANRTRRISAETSLLDVSEYFEIRGVKFWYSSSAVYDPKTSTLTLHMSEDNMGLALILLNDDLSEK